MDLIKVERTSDVTCQKYNNKEETVDYTTKQRVVVQQEQDGDTFTVVEHDGEQLLMSVENLQKLYALIGGALGEYYNELVKIESSPHFTLTSQIVGRMNRDQGGEMVITDLSKDDSSHKV